MNKVEGPRGVCRRCKTEEINMVPSWGRVSPAPEAAKVFKRIKAVMEGQGQTIPIVVRRCPDGGFDVVDPDGQIRLKAAEELGFDEVDIYLLDGEISDLDAIEMAIGLIGARAEVEKDLLATSLEKLLDGYDDDPDEIARLARSLPFRTKNLAKTVERLRKKRIQKTITASHVDLKFRLQPDAAQVVGEAVDYVVANNDGVTRDRAIELIAADFMSGAGGKS